MRRHLSAPSHLKVAPGYAPPQRIGGTGSGAVAVKHYAASCEKLMPAISGFKTSAAMFCVLTFLTSLSANLRIDLDCPSPLHMPINFRVSIADFIHPPLHLSYSALFDQLPYSLLTETTPISTEASPQEQALPGTLPHLRAYTAESGHDRADGLRLIADSVAQQRQEVSRMLMLHPINLAVLALVIALLSRRFYTGADPLLLVGSTVGGVLVAFLAATRWATRGYMTIAKEIDREWLGNDRVIVVKWGKEVIGALVMGWADPGATKKPKGSRKRMGKALVRAWTVQMNYRGKGVGQGLLEEAVKVAGEKGADGILFARDHANSQRVLPHMYNGMLDRKEAQAEKALERVTDAKGNFRQRRSSPTWGSR